MRFIFVQIRVVCPLVRTGAIVVTIRRGENSIGSDQQKTVWLVTIMSVGRIGVITAWVATGQRTKYPPPFHPNSLNTICTFTPISALWHRMGDHMANTPHPRMSSIIPVEQCKHIGEGGQSKLKRLHCPYNVKPVYISSRKGQCQFLSLWYSEIFSDYYQNLWNYNHCWLWLYKPKVFCYVQFSCVIQIRFLNHAFMKLTCSLKEKALACIHRRKELSLAFIHQKHYKPRQFENVSLLHNI